ncbi:hypothetical protein BDB00DRAFT_818020 [Zychaea mexicana]|uniref:uncharacterized protein n=1 Tax=Zychaea mexicana TaxID=64656 RepID=UPI0022FEABE8|nr:uncharacterized protein BDB00DRAFT_818020 [Zychaea mexicana]KAI9494442.1 hypothetical protein BDB00DRAFT_818020 [Zychaea mexicana]
MSSLYVPKRRSRRIQDREETTQQQEEEEQQQHLNGSYESPNPQPLQNLILNKRRRTGNRERDHDLEAVEEEPDKKQEPPNLDYLDEQAILENENDSESDNEKLSLEDTAKQAREFLVEDLSNKFFKVIASTEDTRKNDSRYQFFKKRCTLPDPLLIEDGLSGANHEKENYISDLSSTYDGRKFLLSSGALLYWSRTDWSLPHSMYQWLFQIVAFESDKFVSRHAYTTLETLWTNLGSECAPYRENVNGKRNLNKYIDVSSFRHVLTSYGAVKSELEDSNTENEVIQMSQDWSDNVAGEQHIPLEQFSSVLRLFGFSIRSWSQAYTKDDVKYVVRLLLQILLDRVGDFLAREVENCIESALSALDEETWRSELRDLAASLVNRFPHVQLQTQITKAMKPTYERCIYLKRMVALASLNLTLETALSKIKVNEEQQRPRQLPQPALSQPLQPLQLEQEQEQQQQQQQTTPSNMIRAPGNTPSSSSNYTTPTTSPSSRISEPEDRLEENHFPNSNGIATMNSNSSTDVEMTDSFAMSRQSSFLSDTMSADEEYRSAASHLDTASSKGHLSSNNSSSNNNNTDMAEPPTPIVEESTTAPTSATISPPSPSPTPGPNIYAQTPLDKDVLAQLLGIIQNKHSIFKSREAHPDYDNVLNQTLLLAEAISADETEMIKEKGIVCEIISELQQFNRRIGGGLGSYARSKANEGVQRLWTRLAYMKGRDETMGYEDHVA